MATGGSEDDFDRFVDDHGLTFPQIDDASGDVFARFRITIQHAVVVIAPDGTVTTMPGAVDLPALERVLSDITA